MSINLSNIAILNIKDFDYHYIISRNSKSEALKLLQNIDLTEKVEHYKAKHQEQTEDANLLQILI